MIALRGCSGFGDACYLYPVVKHYSNLDKLIVYTKYPEFYENLKTKNSYITFQPYIKGKPVDYDCSYVQHRENQSTNTFQDTLTQAKMSHETKFEIGEELPSRRTGIVLVSMPYKPDWCLDEEHFVPARDAFDKIAVGLDINYKVMYDMNSSRPLKTWVNLFKNIDYVITQSSHILCLAEALSKKCCVIFNHKYTESAQKFVTYISPKKVIINPGRTIHAFDNEENICHKIKEHLM